MSAMVVPPPYTRQHTHSTSRNLLNLDCSADLRSYRRDLGPGVQAKCFEKTSDTIRAQLDNHRAILLRHRQSGQASVFPSPVPRLEVPRGQTVPSNRAGMSQVTPSNDNYHTAFHPRPLQILSQPHAPQQTRPSTQPQRPVAGDVTTYPTDLRRALEQCAQYPDEHGTDTAFEVVVHVASTYMDDSTDVVGACRSLQEANMQVAEAFLFHGYHDAGINPTYQVEIDGGLQIEVMIEGSMGGRITISVEEVPIEQAFGSKRR
ncbi:hypothetical protein SVAN01_07879 [Stagonosporopsis vannaccii]|nr:hypothetical protein SVAN01_07879 [Stagonosporopsis vannaccii]